MSSILYILVSVVVRTNDRKVRNSERIFRAHARKERNIKRYKNYCGADGKFSHFALCNIVVLSGVKTAKSHGPPSVGSMTRALRNVQPRRIIDIPRLD